MAQSTAARGTARAATGARGRNPELDATRALALVAAVTVLVAPAPLPAWLGGPGLSAASLLPAAFAAIAGVALAHQGAAHAGASVGWWTGRAVRRVLVLVGVGLLLQLLTELSAGGATLDGLLLTGTLARLGVATAVGMLLVRLPTSTQVVVAAVLVTAHGLLVLGGDGAAGGALAGWDARLLGGRARTPIDPDGVTALAPTVALVLAGAVLGDWLRRRPRGASTVGLLLLATAGLAAAARWTAGVLPTEPALWSPPVLLGGLALTSAGLAVGQAATRRPLPDRWVAVLAAAGRVTLPLWTVAVLANAWFADTAAVRWVVREVLWPPLGDSGATAALGLLVSVGLVWLGGALVDRGWVLRA